MNILIILIILVLLYIVFEPCKYSFTSKSGRLFKARSTKVANLIEVVIYISHDLAKKINENDGKRLHSKLQNTSFIELINGDSQILAWNYDKGREIGIRVYDDNNVPYDADTIITSLLHELAHSICKTVGHNTEWEEKNNYLQGFKGIYIEYLINNTFINK
jgi:hypothetical protein